MSVFFLPKNCAEERFLADFEYRKAQMWFVFYLVVFVLRFVSSVFFEKKKNIHIEYDLNA